MHAPLFGSPREEVAEAPGTDPETIILELPKPALLIKHSLSAAEHLFELWVIPTGKEFEKLLDACVASKLLLIFEGGLKEARRECQDFIDENYPSRPVLWVEKEAAVEAVEKG
jgi:hypothetical protein